MCAQDQDLSLWPAGGERPTSPVPLNHYLQNMISPRSRVEYDDFNRFHFSQLRHARDKRAVTPKVGRQQETMPCPGLRLAGKGPITYAWPLLALQHGEGAWGHDGQLIACSCRCLLAKGRGCQLQEC